MYFCGVVRRQRSGSNFLKNAQCRGQTQQGHKRNLDLILSLFTFLYYGVLKSSVSLYHFANIAYKNSNLLFIKILANYKVS